MRKIIYSYFDKWGRPILFSILTMVLFIFTEFVGSNTLGNVCFILFALGLIGLIISLIYQIVKARWLRGIFTFFILVMVFCLYVASSFVASFVVNTDNFADDLKIPTNIPIENPIDMSFGSIRSDSTHRPDSMPLISKMDLQLYSYLLGAYEYDFWVGKIDSGTIYLRAFEITHEDELSTGNLRQESTVSVVNTTDSIRKFGITSPFTIYEGDIGKPYAARFEVWFKPASGEAERKLFAKNYKIEGWER